MRRNDAIIHDWNTSPGALARLRPVQLQDETLRDGLQNASARDPSVDEKKRILRLMEAVGIDSVNVGLPGAGERARREAATLLAFLRDEGLSIRPNLACRTHPDDLLPAIDLAQEAGVPIEAMCFLGTSPVRLYTEGWTEDDLERRTREAIRLGTEGGLGVNFVTEDTTRSHPRVLRRLFAAAIEEGATGLVLCDTVGHATPEGVQALVSWTHELLHELDAVGKVRLEWHGHDDRGLGLANSLAAIEQGVDRIHGTILGIGERVGNASLDHLLVNLRLAGVSDRDLTQLDALVQAVAAACEVDIDPRYPVFGHDAFRTGTGVHAAAVIKARRMGDEALADRVYSSVPARWVGREQEITVSFMSGASNVRWWLEQRGLEVTEARVQAILQRAKAARRSLTDAEILDVLADATAAK